MQIDIDGKVYNFKFGIGFLKEINKGFKVEATKGIEKEAGFAIKAAGLMDGNVLDLFDVLMTANKTEEPKIAKETLEGYLDDEGTDIDALFRETMDFLSQSNACRSQMRNLSKMIEANKGQGDVVMFPPKL